ncbi:MAG: hypothetical protein A3E90_03530 [Candidatus Portnoybacteria bacterium RIFCSPHIGHO2_12_FULL_40_11]|uniref:Uncharacterized protein n=3 Tax=Candidatus Portnoyibacteriota TaxID=1817913 RepID=A0A1G2FA82_9BACT|nr:MAG: hypothetical protein A2815_00855 [Candidatus Portnoybacteria bacterium RIFCSPHIGHO2_01_FULL_40_12b]OGZ38663.1 MAG: hypothetical protein A3E90_03530 [Candidatus Portnoybacteria bacterium RIFCSPHIGHO2_12_FULL_40_11]OGZ40037.1 MAG: hypothetical protein A3I20_01455 [Candidatus Portnoybacteria bacterium RIFCSPLOWO2_02_FULL_40_15]
MIFLESDNNGYRKTSLREGDAVIFFPDGKRVVLWRGDKYLFWSSLSELSTLLFPATDIKLFYDFNGGANEFRERAVLFANRYRFNLKRKEMSFGRNILDKDIPYVAFEFIIKEEVIENGNVGYCSTDSQMS